MVLFGLGVATIVAIAVSVRRRKPSRIRPWILTAVALSLFLAASAVRSYTDTLSNLTESRALFPDLVSLLAYPVLAIGLLGFSRKESSDPRRYLSILLDGLIAALALAAVAWVFAIQPVILRDGTPMPVMLILVAYPTMSIFVLVVTLRLAFSPEQERVPAYWFLLAAMSFMFLGDVLYMLEEVMIIDLPSPLLNLPYVLAYVAAGATAVHPSMHSLTEPSPGRGTVASRTRIALVAVALLTPALLTLQRANSATAVRVVLFFLMLAMTVAAIVRIVQALRTAERSEAGLIFQAHHDRLTGLPNRLMMEEHLARLLAKAPVDETHVAVLYLDLDRFKLINDTLGHSYGDQLLVEVAQRLRANVRPVDLVTRIGGDEFMIILGNLISISQALDLTNRLRACLDAPFLVGGMTFYVSASVGLAFASGDDPDATAEVLIRDADTAMYQAKDAGRGAVAVFDDSMRARITERVELEHELRDAVAQRQLHLVYQPIVRLPHGTTVGMEALARWTHPTHGVISPAKFIPLAEDAGLITEIGGWVLEEAVSQLAEWTRQWPNFADLYVSVNLSGAQLYDAQLVDRVADVLAIHGLRGSALCLELTESVVMEDHAAAAATLEALRQLGVRIAIDDFGCEYSSLAYVKRFPVTDLKIDKSFVDSLDAEDSPDATLVATIVAMARAFGMTTVAEGVETPSQAARLTELGCDKLQGYLYSRPVGSDRLPDVVASLGAPRLQLVPSGA